MDERGVTRIMLKTLRFRLMLWLILAAVIACTLMGVVGSICLNVAVNEGIVSTMNASMAAYSRSVGTKVSAYFSGLDALAGDDRVTKDAPKEDLDKLSARLAASYGFLEAAYIPANGITSAGEDVSGEEFFIRAMAGESFISCPIARGEDGALVIYLAKKVVNESGYDGIVAAIIDAAQINDLVAGVSLGQAGYAFIVDRNGTIVAHKVAEYATGNVNFIAMAKQDDTYKTIAAAIENLLKTQSGQAETPMEEGRMKIVYYCPVEGAEGWVLGIVTDKQEMLAGYTRGITNTGVMGAFVVILLAVLAYVLSNRIAKPLSLANSRLELLSRGDLATAVELSSRDDETGQLSMHLRKTVDSLRSHMEEITNAASSVEDASAKLSNDSQTLAQGSQEQAASIEELLATINSIAEQVNTNAAHTENAKNSMEDSRAALGSASEEMKMLSEAMSDINSASITILGIAKTIEDIAFQTNILAINASIEASRAGSKGNEFGVIANEVRMLANKCSDAAGNTSKLVNTTIEAVKHGIDISKETNKRLNGTVTKAEEVAALVNEIANASAQQAVATSQAVVALNQISDVVQNNAATSEESAASSQELAVLSETLQQLVKAFKLR